MDKDMIFKNSSLARVRDGRRKRKKLKNAQQFQNSSVRFAKYL
jgi:hypothetical protein